MTDKRRSPCYYCDHRNVGCHTGCEDYETYRARLDDINKEKRKETVLNIMDTVRKLNAKKNEEAAHQRRKERKRDDMLFRSFGQGSNEG